MYCTVIPTGSVKSYVRMDYSSPYNNTIQAYSSVGIVPHVPILGSRWSGWSQQGPNHLNSVKEPWTHPTGGCVSSNADLNGCWEEKISFPHRGFEPRTAQPVEIRYTRPTINDKCRTKIQNGWYYFHYIRTCTVCAENRASVAYRREIWGIALRRNKLLHRAI